MRLDVAFTFINQEHSILIFQITNSLSFFSRNIVDLEYYLTSDNQIVELLISYQTNRKHVF